MIKCDRCGWEGPIEHLKRMSHPIDIKRCPKCNRPIYVPRKSDDDKAVLVSKATEIQ